MRTGIRLQLAHLIVLSSRALISDTRNHEFFCFRTNSEPGRTQCSFLQRPSAVASVLFYWTIWTAEHRVEECSVSAEPALIQNYMSVCHERGIWDLHKTSSLRLNITLLFEPDSPCDFRPIALGNLRWHRYLDTGYQVGSGTRMRQKRAWILPGTLWCGRGSRAGDYEQLGMFERVDRCCREHDHCDRIIRPFTVNFGVFNPTLFTISHCDCDYRFKQCLLGINDTVSNMVGYTFFNILKLHCFELIQKKRCTKINWIGMCTSDKVAPYAILKHPTIYNATTSNAAICDVTSHLDDCKYRIHPMEKLYGHHNRETTTIYHCDCIHRLTDHLKQLESIALLEKLLWKFVSMSCIEIPDTKECSNDTRCSAILYTATELESSLIKLEGFYVLEAQNM
ncbi:hypothetical protein PDJAM_G00145520 [Pangasius djambal]|uniref:Uncharacterized protein n=1 Tax=Pangasius djambal TaxID=1691987 RepID=A0ACC5ZF36_9TELE|nr:hypothetical protein [Pangasius djambal]